MATRGTMRCNGGTYGRHLAHTTERSKTAAMRAVATLPQPLVVLFFGFLCVYRAIYFGVALSAASTYICVHVSVIISYGGGREGRLGYLSAGAVTQYAYTSLRDDLSCVE